MASSMFLKLGTIKGESVNDHHQEEIDILHWDWGFSNSSNVHHGHGGGVGKVSVQDFTITKRVDRASPDLIVMCCDGTVHDKAEITLRKQDGTDSLAYYKITLEEVLVSNVSSSGVDGPELPTETVTLNFARFRVAYTPQGTGGVVENGWDVAKVTAMS